MLEKIKHALRIMNVAYDGEIEDIIQSCYLDLQLGGITNFDFDDPIIERCVILYAKGNFGLESKDSEKYSASYEYLKRRLSLSGEYNPAL